jgi:hypothetical protein
MLQELMKLTAEIRLPLHITVGGEGFGLVKKYRSSTGPLAGWKRFQLCKEDANQWVTITVSDSRVFFSAPSGTADTALNLEWTNHSVRGF